MAYHFQELSRRYLHTHYTRLTVPGGNELTCESVEAPRTLLGGSEMRPSEQCSLSWWTWSGRWLPDWAAAQQRLSDL